ncbi:uncharacterized protein RCC_11451 [Ramularia collo-cygni]|uniref:Major facilitator superfamily (MFS) profile domain-containing protein n=1 Tax=Ramularia collo-cygni TaxID=112498 RepID=A0A2D3V649_9PEZI|nr:uncharacterized protein RCC_11451 [Ramularia collo-cygni]CZT25782.1 uncharacterized protein RCC_11451 [Ramularia collo-cygni]
MLSPTNLLARLRSKWLVLPSRSSSINPLAAPPTSPESSKEKSAEEGLDNNLNGWKLAGVVISLNAANGVASVDLLGVTAVLPAVSDHFTSGGNIAWAATTQLIGATVGLAVLGYLSDTWSRRKMLLISISILILSSLACALSRYQSRTDLFSALRTCSGIATGSISNLVNIAQNDFLPPARRLKYQGVQGTSVALGSILGMMVGAVFASSSRWHFFYYFVAALAACSWLAIFLYVPANRKSPERDQIRAVVGTIDFWGILSGTAFIVPGLLMLSKNSNLERAVLIVLGTTSAISLALFLYLGFKGDRGTVRPIVPFELFRNRTIATVIVQNIFLGAAYYTFNYYMPINLQVVRELSPIKASSYQVPYYITHGVWSTASALIILRLQRKGGRSYSLIFFAGFATWTIAMVALAVDSEYPVSGVVIFLMVLVGIGTGSSFQNSVMAISAQASIETRGLAVGTRNVLRFFGGALGTAISSAVMRNRLLAEIPEGLVDFRLAASTFSNAALERFNAEQADAVQHAYNNAITWVFGTAAIMVGVCFVLCPLIKDQSQKQMQDEESGEKGHNTTHTDSGPGATSTDGAVLAEQTFPPQEKA